MITFEQFLQRFCKRAGIQQPILEEELTAYIRREFFVLCNRGVINSTYLKRYKSYFERVGVIYNKTNRSVKDLCIFAEGEVLSIIGENALVYCINSSIIIKDNVRAICKNSKVSGWDNAKLNAIQCYDITLLDNAEAVIENCSNVKARNNVKIHIVRGIVSVSDYVTVEATDTCYVKARNYAKITAKNNIYIEATDDVEIKADLSCSINHI